MRSMVEGQVPQIAALAMERVAACPLHRVNAVPLPVPRRNFGINALIPAESYSLAFESRS